MIKSIDKLVDKGQKLLKSVTEKIILPGFKGSSLYDIGYFFVHAIRNGSVPMRASAVAFDLFIAIFPALIFLFSLIPFVPIENFQVELFEILKNILPQNAYSLMYETIQDTIMTQHLRIMSVGFLLMLFFSSSGVRSLIAAFNKTSQEFETRSYWSIRIISVVLVLLLSLMLIAAITMILIGNNVFLSFLGKHPGLDDFTFMYISVGFLKWILIISIYFLAISLLYYLAPAKKSRFRFITPGAIFATFLQIITVLGFSYYVNNFAQYNKLYGSIGTIIVVMLLIYITSLALIIGFELNVSIFSAKNKIKRK